MIYHSLQVILDQDLILVEIEELMDSIIKLDHVSRVKPIEVDPYRDTVETRVRLEYREKFLEFLRKEL